MKNYGPFRVKADEFAIYLDLEVTPLPTERDLGRWEELLKEGAREIFAHRFGLALSQVELVVELKVGSVKAKLLIAGATLLVILETYNTVHDAAEHAIADAPKIARAAEVMKDDFRRAEGAVANLFKRVTHGQVKHVYETRPHGKSFEELFREHALPPGQERRQILVEELPDDADVPE